MKPKIDRKARFKPSKLTVEEKCTLFFSKNPSIRFVRQEEFTQGFCSELGNTRSKTAFVFTDTENNSYLFTKNEVKVLQSIGVPVSAADLVEKKKSTKKAVVGSTTLKDLF